MKAQTPMSVMKPELDKLRAFSLLNFFALNGRPKKPSMLAVKILALKSWWLDLLRLIT